MALEWLQQYGRMYEKRDEPAENIDQLPPLIRRGGRPHRRELLAFLPSQRPMANGTISLTEQVAVSPSSASASSTRILWITSPGPYD
ncbi:hypothetical protein BC938DRAFT_478845 [Jimgerdemannia flammicorona]|uniref:Uncharacterized protein n=1 Tax=Jimgerdemannia flammicorona TaxID=994334 RepID=A0A433QM62_9FUNG|nr:hypothetical protein BC938DRAFT_478845 [Jimgerdemannia flammicorona]